MQIFYIIVILHDLQKASVDHQNSSVDHQNSSVDHQNLSVDHQNLILLIYLNLIIMTLLTLLGLIGNRLCVYSYYNVAPAHLPTPVQVVHPSSYLSQYPPFNLYPYTAYNPTFTAYYPAYAANNPALPFNSLAQVFPVNCRNAPTATFSGV